MEKTTITMRDPRQYSRSKLKIPSNPGGVLRIGIMPIFRQNHRERGT